MNFTPQQRTDLLNNNGWSKNDVRQLIRDCEELETKLSIPMDAEVKPESTVKDFLDNKLTHKYLTDRWDLGEIENLSTALHYIRKLVREHFNIEDV
jgi:hypothetical protein